MERAGSAKDPRERKGKLIQAVGKNEMESMGLCRGAGGRDREEHLSGAGDEEQEEVQKGDFRR